MLGEKHTYMISDCLFITQERVKELKKATKNKKNRPEFPKKLGRYSFMQINKPGEGILRIMQLNELRGEYFDKDILEAIKRGENIDQRAFMFFY